MKGMTFEFAVTRVFELESKQEFYMNRLMVQGYLKQLERGLKLNQQAYLEANGKTMEEL